MYISKRKSGIFHLFYQQENGKLTSVSTGTKLKSEALKFLTGFKEELKKKNTPVKITLKDYTENFMQYSNAVHTLKTQKAFQNTFNFVQKYFGDVLLENLDRKRLGEFFQWRIVNSSVYQARKDQINLSSALSKAVVDRYLEANPFRDMKKIRIPEKEPVVFTVEELEKLVAVIDDKDIRDVVVFTANTGLRQMEALRLEWLEVNLERRFLMLSNRSHITKSKRIRTVPLNNTAYGILAQRSVSSESGYVFSRNGRPFEQDHIVYAFKKYVKKAGIRSNLHFHGLRRYFGTRLIQLHAPIFEVSRLLGHAAVKTTTDSYLRIIPEDLRQSVELLDRV